MSSSQGSHHAGQGSHRGGRAARTFWVPRPPGRTPHAEDAQSPDSTQVPEDPRNPASTAGGGRDALRRLLPQVLVLALLAGGASAFVAHDKTIELSVDGETTSLRTFASNVSDLLEEEGVEVGGRDMVAPATHESLADGDRVAVRYGRPMSLTVDGRQQRLWTTERTVAGALRQLGVRAEGAHLSTSRSKRISRSGMDLAVRTERSVSFLADGRMRHIRTNAATVRAALAEAGLKLRHQDTVSAPLRSFPKDGQTISLQRITTDEEVREESIPFPTERYESGELYKGTEVVEQRGRVGVRRVTFELRTVNGEKQKPRQLSTKVVSEPRKQIVKVGTKDKPTPKQVRTSSSLNWPALAECESGGRVDAVDPTGTYGGLYQFDQQTWESVGGTGRPQDASAAEQTQRAEKLYAQRGASPWPVCGRKLHQ